MPQRSLLLLLSIPSLILAQKSCYFPDGTPSTEQADDWTPCDPDASVSVCCESTHVCLSNGLCFDTIWNHVIRGACTDSTFSSRFCPQICTSFAPNTLADLRQCNNDNLNWSCGLDPSSCDNPFSVNTGDVRDYRQNDAIIAAGPAGGSSSSSSSFSTTASSSTSSTTSTSSATAAAQTTSSSSPSATSNSSSTSATTVGLGAGLGVGLPLLLALLAALFFLFRARKQLKELKHSQQEGPASFRNSTATHQPAWSEHKSPAIPPEYQSPMHSSQAVPHLQQQQVLEAPTGGRDRAELQS